MCGIAGFVDFNKKSNLDILEQMVKSIRHRGPDDCGVELIDDSSAQVGFGQARLSIIDLSSGGHQPMQYKNLTIVFNGEIYNYREVKEELISLGHEFASNSDTETILHAVSQWGGQAVHKFIGMFVFCIYDSETKTLSITRDRAGVKPLYYYFKNGLFLFASELKALIAHPHFEKEVSPEVIPLFLQYGYVPAPHSIFKHTYKLLPGHQLKLELHQQTISTSGYWNALDYYAKDKLNISYHEAKTEVHRLLQSACAYRMVADVPVGVFLSGGYDSTAVTAIQQAQQSERLKTFTIGFEEGNNEAPYAKATAKYLGTDHTEYYCSKKAAHEIIPTLPFFYDEPFGDSSAIPTILVSQLARKQVTVALSADAGDELFCGYTSYLKAQHYNRYLNKVPFFLKSPLGSFGSLISQNLPLVNWPQKHQTHTFFKAMNVDQNLQMRDLFQFMNEKPQSYLNKFLKNPNTYQSPYHITVGSITDCLEIPMAIDYQCYLSNDILTKVDRATMSVSLEGREPLLDHRLLEFIAQLPFDYKYKDSIGKYILKDIVHDYIPKTMMDRPKTGFSLPINTWLRTDLSFLLEEYLSPQALAWSGLFEVDFVSEEVNKFKANKLHYSTLIWYLLMFQMWYKKWILD